MKPLAVLVAVAVLLSAACTRTRRDAEPASAQWARIASTLAGPLDAGSTNECNSGSNACVQAVQTEMTSRFVPLAQICSHRAPFALMYLRVTQAVQRSDTSSFSDAGYISHLDALFAQSYFTASQNWARGHRDQVPDAWRLAFEAADDRTNSAIGDMLLGMNAHISRDLPFAVAAIGVDSPEKAADFNRVNSLLADVQGPLVQEAAQRWDPSVATFTIPSLGETVNVGDIIARWRTEAWTNGERLAHSRTPSERATVVSQIEEAAANRALLIRAATGYLTLRGDGGHRDAFCRSKPGRALVT